MAIVLALISAVVYGTSDYCGGRAARGAPLLLVVLVTQVSSASVSLIVISASGDRFPGGADVAWSIGAGLTSIIAVASFYFALAQGAMTVIAPITAVVSAVVPVAVGIATGERPAPVALVGVVVALVAVALISGATRRAERVTPPRIVGLAVVAGAGFGLLFVFLDRTSDASGFWPLLIGQLTTLPIVVLAVIVTGVGVRSVGRAGLLAAAAGALAVLANVSYLVATREGLLSLVAVITSMYPASTVVLATVLDHERLSRPQVLGLGLAVTALGMVAVGA
jgi:drug/metabolite transporter (DMT)-like permease